MEEEVADMVCSLKVMKVIENLCLFSAPLQCPAPARTIWHIKSTIHTQSSETMPSAATTPAQASTPLDRLSPLLERTRVRAHLFHNRPLCGVTRLAAAPGRGFLPVLRRGELVVPHQPPDGAPERLQVLPLIHI